jgi:hypothetical protein
MSDSAAPVRTWRTIGGLAASLNAGAPEAVFTPHAIRHYVRGAVASGLAPSIRRLGRKILIDEVGFRQWIDRHGRVETAQGEAHERHHRT